MIRALLFVLFAGLGVAVSLAFGASMFETPMRPEYSKPAVHVIWTETNDIKAICQNPRALACAIPGDPCLIWTYPDPDFHTFGHELMHCFKGRWHP